MTLEEARKRDHRKLGRELKLFSFHPEAPASPFFHPNGATIYRELIRYVEALCLPEMRWLGYQPETIDGSDPVALDGFEEPVPINRSEFDAGYSTNPVEVAAERERMRLLADGGATGAEQAEFFRFPGVYRALADTLS